MASKLDKAKMVIKEHIESAMCGIFNTRNMACDDMVTIYNEGILTVDICYEHKYFEVFGLSMSEFQQLKDFYETLCEEVRTKEKETTEMNDYIEVVAEHGVSCIIKHQKQEETEICVKIIKHATRYEVIYKDWRNEPWRSYTKFYVGLPCLSDIRDDIQHYYGAGCINVNDIMALLDEALGVVRTNNLNNMLAKQLINSKYGLASSSYVYWNIDVSGEEWLFKNGSYLKPVKSTARDEYRRREKLPEISEVIFNKPATIVKWADGTKTVVKAQGKERYNKEKGLAMAIAKKAMGNSNYYYTIMERYLEDKK